MNVIAAPIISLLVLVAPNAPNEKSYYKTETHVQIRRESVALDCSFDSKNVYKCIPEKSKETK